MLRRKRDKLHAMFASILAVVASIGVVVWTTPVLEGLTYSPARFAGGVLLTLVVAAAVFYATLTGYVNLYLWLGRR